jgi:hypothetical protein
MFTGTIQKGETTERKTSFKQFWPFLVLSVFALTIFAGNAHAQIVGDLDADIPFQFHVGNKELPAGKYRIHMVNNSDLTAMEIISADDSTSALFRVQETDANSAPTKSELIFNKYGNRYFLAELFDEGNPSGSELIESAYEKQISKGAVAAQEHLSVHHRSQQRN